MEKRGEVKRGLTPPEKQGKQNAKKAAEQTAEQLDNDATKRLAKAAEAKQRKRR